MKALLIAGFASVISIAGIAYTAGTETGREVQRTEVQGSSERVSAGGITAALTATSGTMQVPGYTYHPYDGRFIFVRVFFEPNLGNSSMGRGRGGFGGCGREDCWHHDYPKSDRALTAIVSEITDLRSIVAGEGNVMRADDPQLMRFPIAYLCEPGFWNPTDKEVAALHAFFTKGGFFIFDDFGDRNPNDWPNFVHQMQRIMPDLRPLPLDGSEPVFHTFFDIGPEGLQMQSYRGVPQFFGYFEDNDKSKRLMAIVDYNNDIGEFMEYSGTGFFPVNESNEAFKIGVDFIIYAITH